MNHDPLKNHAMHHAPLSEMVEHAQVWACRQLLPSWAVVLRPSLGFISEALLLIYTCQLLPQHLGDVTFPIFNLINPPASQGGEASLDVRYKDGDTGFSGFSTIPDVGFRKAGR